MFGANTFGGLMFGGNVWVLVPPSPTTRKTFYWEIHDLITQFVAAFDTVVIKRYNRNRVSQSSLQVRYLYSPKQRVMYDLANKAQNITIPVVSISIGSIVRDNDRVFNKLSGFYFPKTTTSPGLLKTPIPVNINVNMSILTKYQTDMDQILSNFVPYTNPYIVISWKIPEDFELADLYELRSEVLWDGSVSLKYPTDISNTEKYVIAGDTSFTIKAWLFVPTNESISNIFYIDAPIYNSSQLSLSSTIFETLTGETFVYSTSSRMQDDVEIVSLSGNTSTGYVSSSIY